MVPQPLVTAVIPHWRGKEILFRCLKSLGSASYRPLEILLVDNGSSDGSVQAALSEFPHIKVLSPGENKGYSGGCNYGIREVKGEFVLLLNDDAEVSTHFLEPMVEALSADKTIAACQPKIRSIRNPGYFDYAGAGGGFLDQYGFPFCRGRVLLTVDQDKGQFDDRRDIFWASGACCLLRMEPLKLVGLLDEGFFAHMEEIDLQWRLHLTGHRAVVVPSSVVFHDAGTTLDPESPRKVYLNHRNSLLMLLKNHRASALIHVLPVRFLLDLLAFLYRLLNGEVMNGFAILRALGSILFGLGEIARSRMSLASIRSGGTRKVPLYRKSIVWQYFVLRRKTFSQLSGFRTGG
jgi:GT2 family glycosyltransferase